MYKTKLMYNGKEVDLRTARMLDDGGLCCDWAYHLSLTAANKTFTINGNADLNAIEHGIGSWPTNEPSCKCAYCGCTNDHIYGTCDYCGAPLSED